MPSSSRRRVTSASGSPPASSRPVITACAARFVIPGSESAKALGRDSSSPSPRPMRRRPEASGNRAWLDDLSSPDREDGRHDGARESLRCAGSTFWFELTMSGVTRSCEAVYDGGQHARWNVLVVDDHPVNREILEHNLAAWGARCLSVENGRSGLDALATAKEAGDPFDIVLLDFKLPDMDGLAASRAIRDAARLRETPRVLLSSSGGTFDAESLAEAGIALALRKPIRPTELRTALAELLTSQPRPCDDARPKREGSPARAELRGRRFCWSRTTKSIEPSPSRCSSLSASKSKSLGMVSRP